MTTAFTTDYSRMTNSDIAFFVESFYELYSLIQDDSIKLEKLKLIADLNFERADYILSPITNIFKTPPHLTVVK